MAFEFKLERQVEFYETDMAGIVHFSNFFRYMEMTEHAFYRSLGFSAMLADRTPPMGFPRVHAECDYRTPIRFEDRLEIHLLVKEKRDKVLTHVFRFHRLSATGRTEVARGLLTVVCVMQRPDGGFGSTPIPADLAAKIEVAPTERLA